MTLRDELKLMFEKAHRYVQSAEILRRHKDYDSAVSRLYYAMFYAAEALLMVRGHSFSSHKAVIGGFAQHFIKPGVFTKELHQWLRAAFEKRQLSDYDFVSTAEDADVVDMTSKAEQFLSKAEDFLKNEGYL